MRVPDTPIRKPRIEIVPMIDTMFFLLVFFMIATLSMTIQRGMQVNLPVVASVSDKTIEHISLSVKEDRSLYFNKEPTTLDDLTARLIVLRENGLNPSVLINADEKVYHGRVIEVMDAVRLSGIIKTAIAIKPKSQR